MTMRKGSVIKALNVPKIPPSARLKVLEALEQKIAAVKFRRQSQANQERTSTVEEHLTVAKDAADTVRLRVSVAILSVGFPLLVPAMIGWARFFALLPPSWGPVGFWWISGVCFVIMLLALLPTDQIAVRLVHHTMVIFYAFCMFGSIVGSIYFYLEGCPLLHFTDPLSCPVFSCQMLVAAVTMATSTTILCRAYGERSSRRRLLALWLATRMFFVCCGCVCVSIGVLIGVIDRAWSDIDGPAADAHHPLDAYAYALCGLTWLVWGFGSSAANRGRWLATMRRLASHGQSQEAAVVASLVSQAPRSTSETLAIARRTFKGLPCGVLTAEHLGSSRDTGLHALTVPCKPHRVDAFVSHSWHDPAPPKMAAIRAWRAHFEAEEANMGRAPLLWLDKACIAQDDIQASLAALPVYLAWCGQLLVLAGPSYCSRLWCVVEIFTFLRSGGAARNIELVPLDMSRANVLAAFGRFDAAEARCFLESDKQSLLSVLEAGFGSLDAFNEVIRQTFGGAVACRAGANLVHVRATAGGVNFAHTHMDNGVRKLTAINHVTGRSRKHLV